MIYKLGKRPAKFDSRNIRLRDVLRSDMPTMPDEHDFDDSHPGIPTPMFCNDQLGCCVMSGRGHATLRFEDLEQNIIIPISEDDVRVEYFAETGGGDDGLCLLDSLKEWRKKGWVAANKRYLIEGFAEIDWQNAEEVREAIYSDTGVMLGVQLPSDAMAQFEAGQPWAVSGATGEPLGLHCVYCPAYNPTGPVVVTWGRKQQATWEWFNANCDEAYAVIDAPDKVDAVRLRRKLEAVTA